MVSVMHAQTMLKKNIDWVQRKELFLNKINEIKKNSNQINKHYDVVYRGLVEKILLL